MTEWKAVLDRLAVFKLPIRITEYGYETQFIEPPMTTEYPYDAQSEEKKARFLDDFYRLCFSHPAVEGIIMWGHWEGAHWRPGAAILILISPQNWLRIPIVSWYLVSGGQRLLVKQIPKVNLLREHSTGVIM